MANLERTVASADSRPAPGVDPLITTPDLGGSCVDRTGQRYKLHETLGTGATGEVWLAKDRSLGRLVAVKIANIPLPDSHDMVSEARTTATIHHPNVLPVYDLGLTSDGRPFFTMPQVDGRTLGAAIDLSTISTRDVLLRDVNTTVTIGIAICQAAAYAHHRQLVHQDIKPENILLGAFGEVLVLDWGSASRLGSNTSVSGTPLYMAPEQARGEGSTARSDVYGIAATLFHALHLRPPTHVGEDESDFWARKRQGIIDPPDDLTARLVPAALTAIINRALSAEPEQRYADAGEMRLDLARFQAGQAVLAYREVWFKRILRWANNNRRPLAVWATVGIIFSCLIALLWGEQLKERATWGTPIVAESFSDDTWRQRWVVIDGEAQISDGALVTLSPTSTQVMLNRQLSGPTAIEFTGEIPLGTCAGDLSLVWGETLTAHPTQPGRLHLSHRLWLQAGTFGNTFSSIQGEQYQWWAVSDRVLRPAQRHRIRGEFHERRVALYIDGTLVAEHQTDLPLTSGYVGIYCYYSGKHLDDLQVFSLGAPQRLPATAIGDHLQRRAEWPAAATEYLRVAASLHADAAHAAYFQAGRCRLLSGDQAGAQEAWAAIPTASPWRRQIELAILDHLVAHGQITVAAARLDTLMQGNPDLQEVAIRHWTSWIMRVRLDPRIEGLDALLAVRSQRFAQDLASERAAVEALISHGRAATIEVSALRLPATRAEVLAATGRYEEIVRDLAHLRPYCEEAKKALGRDVEVLDTRDQREDPAVILVALGRAEEALAHPLLSPDGRIHALAALGRVEEALAVPGGQPDLKQRILAFTKPTSLVRPSGIPALIAGRPELAWQDGTEEVRLVPTRHTLGFLAWPTAIAAVDAVAHGDHARATALAANMQAGTWIREEDLAMSVALLPGLITLDQDDGAALRLAARAWLDGQRLVGGQRPHWICRYILGEIDDRAFLAQPRQLGVGAWLAWSRALKLELAGDERGAREAWRAYHAMSPLKSGLTPMPVADRIAAWRLSALAGAR